MTRSIEVILNARSGSQKSKEACQGLENVFRRAGRSFHISVVTGERVVRVAEEKAKTDCEVLVAAGGDGTICGVAEAARRSGKILGVIPLGTFNYFANNLGIPLEVEEAARVVVEGKMIYAPLLDLDGRLILNNTSIGIHPAVLMKRRQLYRRWGRSQVTAYLSVMMTAFRPAPRLRVRLETDDGELVRETPLVLVCSNAYQVENFALEGKECLAGGKFAVYVACHSGRATIVKLGLRTVLRRLREGIDYEVICATDVTIDALRRRRLRAAVDGELGKLNSPMRFRVADPVAVLVPQKVAAE